MRKASILFFCVLIWAAPAFGYIDPGSGSIVFQLIVGGLAGLGLAVKLFGHRILVLLRIRKKDDAHETTNQK